MIRKLAAIAVLALAVAGCSTMQRLDASNDVHALLVAIRDNDRDAFDRHVDRRALKAQLESRMLREVDRREMSDSARALASVLAPGVADLAGEALLRPDVFRAAAGYYGCTPDRPLPDRLAIAGALRYTGADRVCATRKKDGPCLLVFTNVGGVWKLTGFEGDLSDLRGKPRKAK